jgi:hypothetical protein
MLFIGGDDMDRNREIETSSTLPAWVTEKASKPRREQALDKCAHCGEKFTLPRSTSIDAIDTAGLFCTLRCAARYGTRAAESRLL